MTEPLPRAEPLERLQQDEAALERGIADARREVTAALEGARREAERIVSAARRDAEREAAALRATAAERAERAAADDRAVLEAELARLGERSGANRPRAVARAVALALGEAP